MNYGPLEFAAFLRRKGPRGSGENRLTVVAGSTSQVPAAQGASVEAVSVYEAVTLGAPCAPRSAGPVEVLVRETQRPVVLVLSSHQAVAWRITLVPGAVLSAVLVSGFGESTVSGAGAATISSIGGFYAFKRGSAEFRHLEREVRRCTGRPIENFQSVYAGHSFEIG
jgi:hypothetical protein